MNKVLLVTGASSDIGRKLIDQVADEYDMIIAHSNKSAEKLSSSLNKYPGKIKIINADFSSLNDLHRMIDSIDSSKIIPTHFVHIPAPKVKNRNFHKRAWEEYQLNIDVSVRSAEAIMQYLLPYMVKKRYGKIVFILSSYTLPGKVAKYQTPYITSKYALLGMMECLAKEYADKGITINGVSPDMVETEFLSEVPELIIEQNARDNPLGRNILTADVIPCIKYLLSDSSVAVTGQNIGITGGK